MRTPLVRTLLLACLTVLLLPAGSARAAGQGGIELVPMPRDGQPQTAFRVSADQDALTFDLVNLSDEPRTGRVFAASASLSESGASAIGAEGSAPWLQLPAADVVLAPKEVRKVVVPLDAGSFDEGEERLGVIVLQALQGAVTVNVATLVTVEPRSALPLPLWAVVVAITALAAAALFLLLLLRRRRAEGRTAPSPAYALPASRASARV